MLELNESSLPTMSYKDFAEFVETIKNTDAKYVLNARMDIDKLNKKIKEEYGYRESCTIIDICRIEDIKIKEISDKGVALYGAQDNELIQTTFGNMGYVTLLNENFEMIKTPGHYGYDFETTENGFIIDEDRGENNPKISISELKEILNKREELSNCDSLKRYIDNGMEC